MRRINCIVSCWFILALAVSCASDLAKSSAVSNVTNDDAVSEYMRKEETAKLKRTAMSNSEIKKTAALIAELTQAVAAYDIHKAFALFNSIDELCAGRKDNAILMKAYKQIQPLLNAISIEALDAPAPVIAGSLFSKPFSARAVVTTPEKQFPLDNFPIMVSYPSSGIAGDFKMESVQTDPEGFIYFTPPASKKAANGILYFYLTPFAGQTAVTDVPENLQAAFPYKVATAEKKIPTIITILDYDENNKPIISSNITATRLLMGLMKRGFSRVGLDEYRELTGTDESQVIKAAQAKIGTTVDRFIFGKTYIAVEPAEHDVFSCTIRADISIWSFKHARKINRFTFEYTAEAKTKTQAIYLAHTTLGESVIAEAFNYNL